LLGLARAVRKNSLCREEAVKVLDVCYVADAKIMRNPISMIVQFLPT
jgi:hypothetical protein